MTTHATTAITAAQRRAIFAAARAKGLTTDDIRGMTPHGSISILSLPEAADLLRRLNAGTSFDRPAPAKQRRPKGVVPIRPSTAIMGLDASLQDELRRFYCWSPEQLTTFLDKRRFTDQRPMSQAQTHRDHVERIEFLKGVLARARKAADHRPQAAGPMPTAHSLQPAACSLGGFRMSILIHGGLLLLVFMLGVTLGSAVKVARLPRRRSRHANFDRVTWNGKPLEQ